MAHLTDLAPMVPSYGYSRRAMYETTVVRASNGFTERNSRWQYPLHVFGLPINNRKQSELETILNYFHAAGGSGNTFDFLDKTEDRSCAISQTPAQDDQTLGTAIASQTDFQLIKNYTIGVVVQSRKIIRPIESSILVEKDTVLQTVTTDYTVEANGIIRFVTPMTGGEVVKAGFMFYVPVAFADDEADITIHNYSGAYVGNLVIELEEDRTTNGV